jgi:penicillin-binding protein 1A
LSLGEAAIIAGLVKAPSSYSPTADVEAARNRAGVVLNSMVENGFVSAAAAASVDPATIRLQPTSKQNSVRYFTDWALPQLETLIDETSDPIDVWTTLDTSMQAAADRAIAANTPDGAQGALVALDRDGAVRAMVGGRDYVDSLYNRATQAERQPGSAFKLFVYLSALESGMKPTDTIVDEPITIDGWSPRNSTRTNLGPVTLREAFSRSINTVSAKIGAQLGFATIADMARRFGISGKISTFPSMVLGTSDVRLVDMTRAFASVANHGVAVSPYAIRKVVTADGRQLYQHEAAEERVLVAPWVAAEMTDLLQSAVLTGTGRAAQIGRPVAGKTGTTSSNKDGWFIGFSSGITAGVWMGRDDARPIAGLQGGTAPARAFHDFMVSAVARRPVEQFETEVPIPDWQLEPEEEMWGLPIDNTVGVEPLVDADGNPLPGTQPTALPGVIRPDGTGVEGQWPEEILKRGSERAPQQQPPQQQPRAPAPRSVPAPDPLQPRPDGSQ